MKFFTIEYTKQADKTLRKWKKSNPVLFRKLSAILLELMEHPRTGLGHPEALKGGNGITYSRHITAQDRIIYDIYDDCITVLIIQMEEHYNDK
jgi:toxin YoeB